MACVLAQFKTVRECFRKNLRIPNYQRPYRWTEKNVEQLLEDINHCKNDGRQEYLVGSVILHEKGNEYDIVDGQQRITTLLLLFKNLKCDSSDVKDKLTNIEYNHCDSFYHIRENSRFIRDWLSENIAEEEKNRFMEYVLDKCEFVEIVIEDLHEAFQMFESQNGRGKELEAYNLLKAYHIRAMNDATETDKINCDRRWEDAAIYDNMRMDLLRQIINEQLYRSRLWSRGESAYWFSKKHIDEFKGFTINRGRGIEYVYQNSIIRQEIANSFMRNANMNIFPIRSRFLHGDPDNMNPFVNINQLILNGKAFFDYVETYVEMYKRLFLSQKSSQLADFKEFYAKHCFYNGSQRSGDTYIREVYKSAIMMLFDKFGEEGVNKLFYKDIYICLYQYRIRQKAVRYSTMANSENSSGIFRTIEYAKTLSDLHAIRKKSQEIINDFRNNEDSRRFIVEEVLSVFMDEKNT